MHRSRQRKCNAVNAASLARWIVMTAFLALAGLSYVYLTLQLYHMGERRKAIENELAALRTQNDIASAQIAALLGVATPIKRRLPENGPDFGSTHRAADDSRAIGRRRRHPTRSQSAGAT